MEIPQLNIDALKKFMESLTDVSNEELEKQREEDANDPYIDIPPEEMDAIYDQMERMGGGNLIGRPSQYESTKTE